MTEAKPETGTWLGTPSIGSCQFHTPSVTNTMEKKRLWLASRVHDDNENREYAGLDPGLDPGCVTSIAVYAV